MEASDRLKLPQLVLIWPVSREFFFGLGTLMNLMKLLANWPEHLSFSNGSLCVCCALDTHVGYSQVVSIPMLIDQCSIFAFSSLFQYLSTVICIVHSDNSWSQSINPCLSMSHWSGITPDLHRNFMEVVSNFATLHLLLREAMAFAYRLVSGTCSRLFGFFCWVIRPSFRLANKQSGSFVSSCAHFGCLSSRKAPF